MLSLSLSLCLNCVLLYLTHPPPASTSYCSVSPISAVLNRLIQPTGLLFVAPELLFLHHVFWLSQHVYTGTCLHANDTQTAGLLTAASATFNFHFRFRSSSRIHILPVVRDLK